MVCKHCQTEAPEGARFCPGCGKRMPRPLPQQAEAPIIRVVDPLLKPDDAAELLKISRWKLDEMRRQHKMPQSCYCILPGGSTRKTVRYYARELMAWASQLDEITTAG